jgi:hypothetical protein
MLYAFQIKMYTKSLEVISSGNVFEEQLGSPLPHFGWKLLSYFLLPQYKAYIIIQTFAFDVGKTRKQEFGPSIQIHQDDKSETGQLKLMLNHIYTIMVSF